jgi:SAM-dependent methyltransferase
MTGYIFDQAWEKEHERLVGLESVWDPGTIHHLQALGISEGWTCWEVGAGAGSIARWLAARVGETGHVTATDLDTRFLDPGDFSNLEIQKHDVVNDEPPMTYDLIHARCLLEHLVARDVVLKRLTTALKPGGWLVIEDLDWSFPLYVPAQYFFSEPEWSRRPWRNAVLALADVMRTAGIDLEYGRELPRYMRTAGLADVRGELRVPLVGGGSPGTRFLQWTFAELRSLLVDSGRMSDGDIDEVLAFLEDPGFLSSPGALSSCWGRASHALS